MNESHELVFLHLSDIHFNRQSAGVYDLDYDLRHEVELDAQQLAGRFEHVDAILVTGDIAFSGSDEEYSTARTWLENLCDIVGCARSQVWTVPGNHDVQRHVFDDHVMIRTLHSDIRSKQDAALNSHLISLLEDDFSGNALFSSISRYNAFAEPFDCHLSPKRPYWTTRFKLGNRLSVELFGLNSTLLSSRLDNEAACKLLLGSYQLQMLRSSDVITVTMCHHPPSWLMDGQEVQEVLRHRAHLQLWGHRHVHGVSEDGASVVLSAGAMQPNRHEAGWEPRYNYLRLRSVADDSDEIEMSIFPRRWDETLREFASDADTEEVQFRTSPAMGALLVNNSDPGHEASEQTVLFQPDQVEIPSDVSERKVRVRFFSIPFLDALSVAKELGLWEEADGQATINEVLNSILRRVSDEGKWSVLWGRLEGQ